MSSDAAAKNLPILEYVLYPKLSGLLCILNTLKERRENQLQLSNSEIPYSTEGPVMKDSHNILNTTSQATNQVDKNNVLGGKNKEHKADCAQNIPDVNSSVTFHESKDGCQKDEKEKEEEEKNTDSINNFEKMKKSVGEFICDKKLNLLQKIDDRSATASATSSKAHRSITALHDLTIAYTDFLPGKKTTHRSILYGKPGYIKPYIRVLLVHLSIVDLLLRYANIAFIASEKIIQY